VRGPVTIGYGEPELGTKVEKADIDKGIPKNQWWLTLLGSEGTRFDSSDVGEA